MDLSFEGLPLEQGLARLLQGKSFALERAGPKNRVSKVWVLSELAPSPSATLDRGVLRFLAATTGTGRPCTNALRHRGAGAL